MRRYYVVLGVVVLGLALAGVWPRAFRWWRLKRSWGPRLGPVDVPKAWAERSPDDFFAVAALPDRGRGEGLRLASGRDVWSGSVYDSRGSVERIGPRWVWLDDGRRLRIVPAVESWRYDERYPGPGRVFSDPALSGWKAPGPSLARGSAWWVVGLRGLASLLLFVSGLGCLSFFWYRW